jgi:hypothetical protein
VALIPFEVEFRFNYIQSTYICNFIRTVLNIWPLNQFSIFVSIVARKSMYGQLENWETLITLTYLFENQTVAMSQWIQWGKSPYEALSIWIIKWVFLLRQLWIINYCVKSSSNNENINTGVSVVFRTKHELKCHNELGFLKHRLSGNTSFHVFIAEIIWPTFDLIIDNLWLTW